MGSRQQTQLSNAVASRWSKRVECHDSEFVEREGEKKNRAKERMSKLSRGPVRCRQVVGPNCYLSSHMRADLSDMLPNALISQSRVD